MSDGLSDARRDERAQAEARRLLHQFRRCLEDEGFAAGFSATEDVLYEWNEILKPIGLTLRRKTCRCEARESGGAQCELIDGHDGGHACPKAMKRKLDRD